MSDVTRFLSAIEQGDPSAAGQLLPLVYDELRKLATTRLAREKPGQTLQPIDNVAPLPTLAGKTVTGGLLNIFKAVSATPLPLTACSLGTSAPSESLTSEQVTPLFAETIARWQASGVETSVLGSVDIRITDLPNGTLGVASGETIWLDDNARPGIDQPR